MSPKPSDLIQDVNKSTWSGTRPQLLESIARKCQGCNCRPGGFKSMTKLFVESHTFFRQRHDESQIDGNHFPL